MEDLTQEDRKVLAARAYEDPVFFCQFFLPHLFSRPIPWLHRGLLALLTGQTKFLARYGQLDKIFKNFVWADAEGNTQSVFKIEAGEIKINSNKFTLIMLPRGFSKTTIAGVAVPLREVLYQDCKFTVYVSEAAPHAKMQLTNVKRELTDNARILGVFGDLRPAMRDDEKWSEDFFETKTGMAMAARGRGSQIRGLNHRGTRPSKIIVDDVEDKEAVSTEAQRAKTREWAYGDLIPALPSPAIDPNARIVALGTLLNRDALLETWTQDPLWSVVRMGVYDTDGDLIWPDGMDAERLTKIKKSYALAAQLHVFYMEYFNQARAPEDQIFKPENFIIEPAPDGLITAIYIDPAISDSRTADHCVIHVCGMAPKGLIYFLESWGGVGVTPREMIDKFFELAIRYKCRRHGVESNAFQAALVHLLREEMFRKKHYFEPEKITHKTKKEDRIIGVLAPRYAAGYIRHAKRFAALESQLLDFRRGVEQDDDYADAAAGAVALLDPHASLAAGADLTADEYEPIDEDIAKAMMPH